MPEAHACERRPSPSSHPRRRWGSALIVQPERELGAVSLFLLAVVAAAVVGGIWAGVGSSVLGFLALNYFFTEPLHTFRVGNRDDVVAIVAFLVVALVVGSVVARAVDERSRATRREREARLLNLFATKALSGEPIEQVLNELATTLIDAIRLSTCLIEARAGARRLELHRTLPGSTPGDPVTVEIASRAGIARDPHGGAVGRGRRPVDRGRAVARGRRPADRGDPRAGHAGRTDPRCTVRRGEEPGASRPVLLGHARPAHAARLDQGVGDHAPPGGPRTRHRAAARAPADGGRGDGPAQPADRQHHRAGEGSSGGSGPVQGADGAR